jgi:hypothetical protein
MGTTLATIGPAALLFARAFSPTSAAPVLPLSRSRIVGGGPALSIMLTGQSGARPLATAAVILQLGDRPCSRQNYAPR